MLCEHPQLPVRQQRQRLFGRRSGCMRSWSAHSSSTGISRSRVQLEQLRLGAARPVPGALRPRAREARVAGHVGEGVAQQVGGGGVRRGGQAHAALGREHAPGAVGEQAVEARAPRPRWRPAPRRGARRRASGCGVHAVGHQHQPRGLQAPGSDRAQQDLRAGVVAGEQRPRAEHLGAEARRSPPRTSRACRGGGAGPRSRRAAAGRAARRGSGRASCSTSRLPLLVREQAECSSASGGPAPNSR